MPGAFAKRTGAELSVTCPTGSFPPAVVRERVVVVHFVCAREGSAIYHGLNKRGK